jgi:eukaryotic-like serine/threonine-protein kinase
MNERSIFDAAIDIVDADQRAAYLKQACGDNAEFRRHLDELIAAQAKIGSFLDQPIAPPKPTTDYLPLPERPGTVIGPYKLLEQIGEGGFGVVFMAEQHRPIRRKVALKVLKPGMDTRQVVARFEAERQALALMDHPNIAHVFDGGETASGRPYFVMELVRGVPVTDFCDQSHLPVRERLNLFINICQAVQHAHQKGVIHRDLKPSNVLVTLHDGTPVPKVIDFGIAKAAGQPLTDKTLFTNFAQMIGTPLYMSPEQAQMSGLDVDTRTDVYALGVLLYELLTGTTPFDKERLRTAAYDEIRRIIREEEPARPSTRLSTLGQAAQTVSANRGSEPRKLSASFRGELDWIVMKALEKDRNRRYESASAFAADIRRYLDNEPVQACPPTAGYRFRKFARRNKRVLATAALVASIVLPAIGAAAASIGWAARDRAARQAALEQEAGWALEEAETWYRRDNVPEAQAAVKRAEGLLAGGGGSAVLGERVRRWQADLLMVKKLDAIRLLQSELKGDQFDLAAADPAYAAAFRDYGLDMSALEPAAAAEIIRSSTICEQLVAALDDWMIWIKPREDGAGRDRLHAVARLADPDDWRNRFRDSAHQGDRRVLEQLADRAEVVNLSPTSIVLLGRALQSVGAVRKALIVLSAAQERHPTDFWLNVEVGAVLLWKMKPARCPQAAGYFRAALALRPDNAGVYCNLGGALRQPPEQLDQAISAYQKAVKLQPDYCEAYKGLAAIYRQKEAWADAIAALREAIRIVPTYDKTHNDLAVALHNSGQLDEAVAEYRKAIRLNADNAITHNNLGAVLTDQDLLDAAIEEYRKAIALKPDFHTAHRSLGLALHKKGLLDEAIAEHRAAINLKPDDAIGHNNHGASLREKGLAAESIVAFRRALALNPKFGRAHYNLALALGATGDRKGAIAEYREAIAAYAKAIESAPRNAPLLNALSWLLANCPYAEIRDAARAVELATKVVSLAPAEANGWNTLGTAHYRAGDWQAAITALEKATALRRVPDSLDWLLLAMAHWQLANKEQARQCYDKAIEWMEKNRRDNDELRRFRAEAAGLLGIDKKKG